MMKDKADLRVWTQDVKKTELLQRGWFDSLTNLLINQVLKFLMKKKYLIEESYKKTKKSKA